MIPLVCGDFLLHKEQEKLSTIKPLWVKRVVKGVLRACTVIVMFVDILHNKHGY